MKIEIAKQLTMHDGLLLPFRLRARQATTAACGGGGDAVMVVVDGEAVGVCPGAVVVIRRVQLARGTASSAEVVAYKMNSARSL